MPIKGLNKAKLKEHLRKAAPLYLLGVVIMCFVSNLVFTMTRPQIPEEEQVIFYLVDPYVNTQPFDDLAGDLLAYGQTEDETLKEVLFEHIAYSGPDDYNGTMLLMVRMAAGGGDVFVCGGNSVDYVMSSGIAYPLDELLAGGWLSDYVAQPITVVDSETEESYIGGISLEPLKDKLSAYMDAENAVLLLSANSTNVETSAKLAEDFVHRLIAGELGANAAQEG